MKFRRTHALVGGIATLAVLLAACGTAMAGNPTTGSQQPTVTATQTATETATATATVTHTQTVPPLIEETRTAPPSSTQPPFTPQPAPTHDENPPPEPDSTPRTEAEIRAEVADAIQVTDTYWKKLFSSWQVQWWTPTLYHGDGFLDSAHGEGYTCNEYDPEPTAGACGDYSGSTELYWNMELFRRAGYIGDGIYYVTVAHEYGHAAQYRFMADGQGKAVPTSEPGRENQADCLAGATLAKAERDGYLTIQDGDLDEITQFLIALADGTGTGHGTSDQRVGIFHLGYDNADIESCLFNKGEPPSGWFGPQ